MKTTSGFGIGHFLRSFLCVGVWVWVGAVAQAQTQYTLRHEKEGGAFLWSVAETDTGVVAVGERGTILTSGDGITWQTVAAPTTKTLLGITTDNKGQQVVVGESGTILRSTDGKSWVKAKTVPTTARLNNVLWSDGKFVAVGEGGGILVSTDGDTWKTTDSGTTNWLRGLTRAAGLWVAVGQKGTFCISTDGAVWRAFSDYRAFDLEGVQPFGTSYSSPNGLDSVTASQQFHVTGAEGRMAVVSITFTYSALTGALMDSSYWANDSYWGYPLIGYTRALVLAGGQYYAAGSIGGLVQSSFNWSSYVYPSYSNWSAVTSPSTADLSAGCTALRSLWFVGGNETIIQSDQFITARLGNISTRGVASKDGRPMIAGMVVTGDKAKKFLIRGVGPGLKPFGVTGTIDDPDISLTDTNEKVIASNRGWGTNLNPAAIAKLASDVGSFALPENSADSAMSVTLDPGTYLINLKSATNKSGVSLVEVYDATASTDASTRLYNISTLGYVGKDSETLVAGFVIQGQSSRRVVIRAVGPTLKQFTVPNTLADPVIKLYRDADKIAENDNWGEGGTYLGRPIAIDEIRENMKTAGGFPLPDDSKDAVIVATLRPGAYTVTVEGKAGGTGNAIVEVYELPGY